MRPHRVTREGIKSKHSYIKQAQNFISHAFDLTLHVLTWLTSKREQVYSGLSKLVSSCNCCYRTSHIQHHLYKLGIFGNNAAQVTKYFSNCMGHFLLIAHCFTSHVKKKLESPPPPPQHLTLFLPTAFLRHACNTNCNSNNKVT